MEFKEKGKRNGPQLGRLWWLKQIALVIVGGFYLYFGIHLLISAYQLKEPFSFILTFFASNFIILISGVLLFGFVYRLVLAYKHVKK
jgi:hypothetical protein